MERPQDALGELRRDRGHLDQVLAVDEREDRGGLGELAGERAALGAAVEVREQAGALVGLEGAERVERDRTLPAPAAAHGFHPTSSSRPRSVRSA